MAKMLILDDIFLITEDPNQPVFEDTMDAISRPMHTWQNTWSNLNTVWGNRGWYRHIYSYILGNIL